MAQTRKKSSAGSGSKKNTGSAKNAASKKSSAKKSSAKKTTAKKNSAARGGSKASGTTASSKKTQNQQNLKVVHRNDSPEPVHSGLGREIFLIILMLASALMFLSNFDLLGEAGTYLREIQFGIFGTMAYVFPVCLAVYIFMNGGENSRISGVKTFGAILLFVSLCGLAGVLGGNGADLSYQLADCYKDGSVGINGGVCGGFLYLNLRQVIGLIGTYAVLVVLALLGFMLMTGRQILAPMNDSVSSARENYSERRAREKEYREERLEKQRREEELLRRKEQQRQNRKERDRADWEERLENGRSVHLASSLTFGEDTWIERSEEEENGQNSPEPENETKNAGRSDAKAADRKKTGAHSAKNERKVSSETPEFSNANPVQKTYNKKKPSESSRETQPSEDLSEITEMGNRIVLNHRGRMSRSELEELDRMTGQEIVAAPEGDDQNSRSGQNANDPEEPEEDILADFVIHGSRRTQVNDAEAMEAESGFVDPESEAEFRPFRSEPEKADAFHFEKESEMSGVSHFEKESEMSGVSRFENESERSEVSRYDNEPEMAESFESGNEPEENTEEFSSYGSGTEYKPPVHPARQEVTVEDSMSAYDDFDDAPDPNAVVNGDIYGSAGFASGSAARTGRKVSTGETGRSSSGKKAGTGDSGDTALPIKEEPVVRREYKFPPLSLLRYAEDKGGTSEDTIHSTAVKLQRTLDSFGVSATVKNASCGPSVTRYELEPAQGVKVRRIVDLADDIKLNLAARDIRIEAPIPGKAAVGIEVPNDVRQTVSLKELIESKEFTGFASRVGVAIGKNVGGDVVVADLAKMPHLLIAGATGSGKSVCINSLIVSILYKATPDEVQLILIDPKMVELSVYNSVPHLLTNVVTDPKKAAAALNWAVSEMTERYKRFAEYGCRDIKGFNKKAAADPEMKKMPQIVIIVDELADLMMVSANEVEEAICRLAQLARAAGIHMVLATQRPSVNVITGLIKANVPSRIAFAVSSGVDSRTILDMNGAEKLLGKGDMLFYPQNFTKPLRVQGAFVSDKEVSDVVDYIKEHNGPTAYDSTVEEKMKAAQSSAGGGSGFTDSASDRDAYFADAGRFIIDKEKGSIGSLQRQFKIGFNRAARIMDQLEEFGLVGPEEGTKPRRILMTAEQFETALLDEQ